MSTEFKQSSEDAESERSDLHCFQSTDRLIDALQKLAKDILSNLNKNSPRILSPLKDDGSHEAFIQNKSIRLIVQRLRVLFHATNMVLQRMDRYRAFLEKLLCDIGADIHSSCQSSALRKNKTEDDVSRVLDAEVQSLKRLKNTLIKYLARVQSSSKDLLGVQALLQGLLNEYSVHLRRLSKGKRASTLLSTKLRQSTSLDGLSADDLNPRKLLTLIEAFYQQALGLRKELDSLFARVPPFIRSTQKSVYQALLNNSAQLMNKERQLILLGMKQNQTRNRCFRMTHALINQSEQPACRTLKPITEDLARLEEAKNRINQEVCTIRRSINSDLQIARTRRKDEARRLFSRMPSSGAVDNEPTDTSLLISKAQFI